MKVADLFESEINTNDDGLETKFIAAVKKAAQDPLTVKVGSWKRTSSGYQTLTVTVEYGADGFAQAVLWKRKGDDGGWAFKIQQHDISLNSNDRGAGIGGKMIAALVAGYKAIGAKDIPIHLNSNPEFWKAMEKKHKVFEL